MNSEKTGQSFITEAQADTIRRAYRYTNDEQLASMLQTSRSAVKNYRHAHKLIRDSGAPGERSTKITIPRPPTTLSLADLKEVYRLHRQGRDAWALCVHFHITMDHCLECIAAARLVHGKRDEYMPSILPATYPTQPVENSATPTVGKPAPTKVVAWSRPKAEYSNRSPYGIASPGLGK